MNFLCMISFSIQFPQQCCCRYRWHSLTHVQWRHFYWRVAPPFPYWGSQAWEICLQSNTPLLPSPPVCLSTSKATLHLSHVLTRNKVGWKSELWPCRCPWPTPTRWLSADDLDDLDFVSDLVVDEELWDAFCREKETLKKETSKQIVRYKHSDTIPLPPSHNLKRYDGFIFFKFLLSLLSPNAYIALGDKSDNKK